MTSYLLGQQERGGPSARDVLLLKCKDAIETLHVELEEERNIKQSFADEISGLQRVIEDYQVHDQDKNFRLQKLTEENLQMQSEIVILQKERERYQLEREEYDKHIFQIDQLEQEYNNLALEKQDLIDQNRRLSSQVEILQTERGQTDIQLSLLKKSKEELTFELTSIKDQLYQEQRKFDLTVKQHSEQLQEIMNREQEKKDAEVRRERDERRVAEKEHQGRLEDLQTKLERLLKEKEKDYKDSVELRVREVQQRYEAELEKLNDQYSKLENDTYKKA